MIACVCASALLPALFAPCGFAQAPFDTWTTENGLPQNSVNDILQSRDGYLWLATFGGLVRFDGSRFVVFDRSVDGIGSHRMRALLEDSTGTLWAATDEGMLIRYRDGRFDTFGSSHGLPHDVALRIDEDAERNLWITWRDVITKYDGAGFTTYRRGDFANDVATRQTVPDMQIGPQDLWWSLDATGLRCLYKGMVHTCVDDDDLPSREVVRVGVDADDTIWISTKDAGALRVSAGTLRSYTAKDGLPGNSADGHFFEDRQGTLWFARTGGGLYRIRDRQPELLASFEVMTLYQDREDSIWVGTTVGLHRLRHLTVTIRSETDGLTSNRVYSVLQDRQGDVWIGTWGGGLNRHTGGRFVSYGEADGLPSPLVTGLYEDRAGRLWVGTVSGLVRLENGRFVRYRDPAAYLTGAVWAMHEDRRGVRWFATDRGLVSIRDGRVDRHTSTDGLPHDRITALAEGRSGTLWIGTFQGIARLDAGVFTAYTERDGLVGNQVRAIYEDADEVLWIGTYDGGLYRLKAGRLTRYTRKNGLHDNGVFQILEDDAGYLWMGSNRGIYRVSRRELNDVAEGRASSVRSRALGTRDGLSTLECNGGRQPSGLKTADGRLWFPTMGGVAIVDPAAVRGQLQPPPAIIEALLVEGKPVDVDGDVTIPYGTNSVEFRYTAASFVLPEQLRFRHRLNGLDAGWTDAGAQRSVTYYRIPPGRYQFGVTASAYDGLWNADVQTLAVFVLAPFWRQAWFLWLATLMTVLLAFLLDRRRVQRHRRERALQAAFSQRLIEAQESERQRISTELHDSLGQDLFIIRAHVRSARQMAADAEPIDEALEAVDGLARQASEDLKEVAHALRPYQLDKIGLSATIDGMVRSVGRACGIVFTTEVADIDARLDAHMEIHTYRIVQECVNNVVKHSGATRARVTLGIDERSVHLRVEDNGCGVGPLTTDAPGAGPPGLGLMTIRERARGLRGDAEVRSAPGEGTTVVVTFPLDRRRDAR